MQNSKSDVDRIRNLDVLVSELTKDQPNLNLIRSEFQRLGLEYQDDPIHCINLVLKELHFEPEQFEGEREI